MSELQRKPRSWQHTTKSRPSHLEKSKHRVYPVSWHLFRLLMCQGPADPSRRTCETRCLRRNQGCNEIFLVNEVVLPVSLLHLKCHEMDQDERELRDPLSEFGFSNAVWLADHTCLWHNPYGGQAHLYYRDSHEIRWRNVFSISSGSTSIPGIYRTWSPSNICMRKGATVVMVLAENR